MLTDSQKIILQDIKDTARKLPTELFPPDAMDQLQKCIYEWHAERIKDRPDAYRLRMPFGQALEIGTAQKAWQDTFRLRRINSQINQLHDSILNRMVAKICRIALNTAQHGENNPAMQKIRDAANLACIALAAERETKMYSRSQALGNIKALIEDMEDAAAEYLSRENNGYGSDADEFLRRIKSLKVDYMKMEAIS